MYLFLALLSALCLGFYDIAKKRSLLIYDVPTVLWAGTVISTCLLLPLWVVSRVAPDWMTLHLSLLYVPEVDALTHAYIFGKSLLVLSSWVCAYFAMKYLPLTLVAPINATRPMWTLLGAVVLFGESLNLYQGLGIAVALCSFAAFSLVGKKEGFSLRDKESRGWVMALLLATLLGAASGLYDKYLMRRFDHNAVLVWYTVYQALVMSVFYACQLLREHKHCPIREQGLSWLPLISVFLVGADFVYLLALTYPDSLISVVSTLRRTSVIIAFAYGAVVMKDKHLTAKFICLLGVLLGIGLLLLGSL